MTIKGNLKEVNIKLQEARILLAFVLNKNKEYLVINEDYELSCEEQEKFEQAVMRLTDGEPLQHITGKQEFMGLEFIVNKDVLIPRADTEILVEEVIDILNGMQKDVYILDLCTGSGAIAISIAKYVENVEILATDISEEALCIAKKNYKDNSKIKFLQSDLFENIEEKFDLIVSNPPYIGKEEMEELDVEVKKEPVLALDGGPEGLDFYRRIISEAYKYLKPDGYLCLEIGYNQRESVIKLIEANGKYGNIYAKKDLAENDRVVICRFYQN